MGGGSSDPQPAHGYGCEYGVAAHWAYKGMRNEEVLNDWLANVRKRLQNPANEFRSGKMPIFLNPMKYMYSPLQGI
jgi:hypothetical protein